MTHATPPISLYDIPTIYDRVMQPGPCEPFYDELAHQTGGPVLDLACGTGRLTIPLARRGHAMVGLDASPTMLERARRKAAEQGVDVAFLEGDMRRFSIDQLFPLILITCNSLAHLTSHEDLTSCLACAARHLTPGGTLALDVVNADVRVLGRPDNEAVRLDLGPNPSSAIAVEQRASYDPIRQVRELRWRFLDKSVNTREIEPLVLRQFFPQEVPLLLEVAGFEMVARYGDFAGNPLTGYSLNQICLARPRHDVEPRRKRATDRRADHVEASRVP